MTACQAATMNEVSVIKEGWLHKRGKGLLMSVGLCISLSLPPSPPFISLPPISISLFLSISLSSWQLML